MTELDVKYFYGCLQKAGGRRQRAEGGKKGKGREKIIELLSLCILKTIKGKRNLLRSLTLYIAAEHLQEKIYAA